MRLPELTDLEERVLLAMFYGLTPAQSTKIVGVNKERVAYVRRAALKKMGARNIVEAVRMLCAAGWDEQDEQETETRQGSASSM